MTTTTDTCPDCGVDRLSPDHSELTPEPSKWSVYDFVQVLQQRWRFKPAGAVECCGVSPLAAMMGKAKIPDEHVHHVVAPQLLWELYQHGLRKSVLRSLILWVYVLSMTPLTRLEADQWLKMFRSAGFTTFDQRHIILDGLPKTERPTEVPTLYRTASEAASAGMSWTSSRSHAELFGRRRRTLDGSGAAPVHLWKLRNVPAEAVLGVQHFRVGHQKGEKWAARGRADEWVLDPTGLEPEMVPAPPCGCPNHWGDIGAAGLLVGRVKDGRVTHVLLQLRDDFSQEGRKWGLPGGALEPGEDDRTAALREAVEETGIDVDKVRVVGQYRDTSHGPDWHYTTVLATSATKLKTDTDSPETEEARWVKVDDVADLRLHPGLEKTWPKLRKRLTKKASA